MERGVDGVFGVAAFAGEDPRVDSPCAVVPVMPLLLLVGSSCIGPVGPVTARQPPW